MPGRVTDKGFTGGEKKKDKLTCWVHWHGEGGGAIVDVISIVIERRWG